MNDAGASILERAIPSRRQRAIAKATTGAPVRASNTRPRSDPRAAGAVSPASTGSLLLRRPRRRGRALSSGVRRRTTPEMSLPSVLVNATGLLPNSPSNEAYPRVRPSPGRIDRVSAAPIPSPSTPPPTASRRTRPARRLHLPRAPAVRRRLPPTALTALLTRTEYVLPQPDACWVQILAERRGVRRILPGQLASVHAGAAR